MFIRRLPRFEYHSPTSLGEALNLLSKYGEDGKILAGGTDLLVSMKKRDRVPRHLINVKGIDELHVIRDKGREGVRIGSSVTLGELERSSIIKEKYRILIDALDVIAAPQIRNLGTVGGNLCSAVPSADTAPPLMALGGSLKLVGNRGEKIVPVEDFFKGPGESVLKSDEILLEVLLPCPAENSGGTYIKLMRRNAMELALVGVAVQLELDQAKKLCNEAKIALGAVAPTPIHASRSEDVLLNMEIDEGLAHRAGDTAAEEARPISDIRASEGYRREMVRVLTKRAVMETLKRIEGEV